MKIKIPKEYTDWAYNTITTYCEILPYIGETTLEFRVLIEDVNKLWDIRNFKDKTEFNRIFFDTTYKGISVLVTNIVDLIIEMVRLYLDYTSEEWYNTDTILDYEVKNNIIYGYGCFK